MVDDLWIFGVLNSITRNWQSWFNSRTGGKLYTESVTAAQAGRQTYSIQLQYLLDCYRLVSCLTADVTVSIGQFDCQFGIQCSITTAESVTSTVLVSEHPLCQRFLACDTSNLVGAGSVFFSYHSNRHFIAYFVCARATYAQFLNLSDSVDIDWWFCLLAGRIA